MKNSIKICMLGISSFLLLYSATSSSNTIYPIVHHNLIQNSDEVFLKQSALLCLEQLRASNLAAKQGGERIKKTATRLTLELTKVSEELRMLAKSKSIDLPTSLPSGGMNPDGRIDSAPENLRDTARLRNNNGQAGNTGTSASANAGLSNTTTNQLIENLTSLKGDAFDQAYTALLNNGHSRALQLLDQGAKSSDSGISNFAKKHLKTIQKISIK